MKILTLLSLLSFASIGYSQQSSFFDHIQTAIESLSANEVVTIEYNKSGDWGSYEGGTLTLQSVSDSINMKLISRQNYLGAKNKVSSTTYEKLSLLSTLEANKKAYHKDPDNLVFNNRFNYRILKNEAVMSSGSSPLEPADVVNRLSLQHQLEQQFFKKPSTIFNNGING